MQVTVKGPGVYSDKRYHCPSLAAEYRDHFDEIHTCNLVFLVPHHCVHKGCMCVCVFVCVCVMQDGCIS